MGTWVEMEEVAWLFDTVTVLFFSFHFHSVSLFHRTITYPCYTCLSLFYMFVSLPCWLLVPHAFHCFICSFHFLADYSCHSIFYFILVIMLNHDDSMPFLLWLISQYKYSVVTTNNPSLLLRIYAHLHLFSLSNLTCYYITVLRLRLKPSSWLWK